MKSNLLLTILCILTLSAEAGISKFSRRHSSGLLPVAALSLGYMPIMSKDGHISVYPNPTTDRIYIKGEAETTSKIELISMLGGVVLSEEVTNGTVSVTDLAPGVYIVRVYGSDGQINLSSKLTKE